MEEDSKIYVAGHTGLIGSAILNELKRQGYTNIVTESHAVLDLTRQIDVEEFFTRERPRYVFLAAARVGGIQANISFPAQFIYENIAIQTNVIHATYLAKTEKLLFLGAACSYPRDCLQPIKEEYLLSGNIEPTNEPYAVAKITGIKMCQSYNRQYGTKFICAIPTNAYGPYDNFNPNDAHVISSLIRKFHVAVSSNEKEINVWGSGEARREFIYSDDVASACLFLMNNYEEAEIINIGSGERVSIKDLVLIIKDITGFKGKIIFDKSKPDGSPCRFLDTTRLTRLGWSPKTYLREGISQTYKWYVRTGGI